METETMAEYNPIEDVTVEAMEPVEAEAGPVEEVETASVEEAEPVAEAEPAVEAKQEEVVEEKTPDKWAEKFEKLSEQEAKIREQTAALAEQQKQLQELVELKELVKADPAAAALRLGVSPAELAARELQQQPDLDARLESIEKSSAERIKQLEDKIHQQEMQRIGNAWDAEFEPVLKSDEFSLLANWEDGAGIVRQYAANKYQETGKMPTPREAATFVQDILFGRVDKVVRAGAYKHKPAEQPQDIKKAPTKTITSDATSTPNFYVNDDDDMERIIAKYS